MHASGPWYYRNSIVLLALIFVAPLGILLLWKADSWARQTKIVVTALAAGWFLVIIGRGQPSPVRAGAPQPQALARKEKDGLPSPPRSPAPSKVPSYSDGQDLATRVPRTLLPNALEDLELRSVSDADGSLGAVARYRSTTEVALAVGVSVKKSGEPMPPPTANQRRTEIGERPALYAEDASFRLAYSWVTDGWSVEVSLGFENARDRKRARDVVKKTADEADVWIRKVLSGAVDPTQTFATEHLAAQDRVVAAVERAQERELKVVQKERKERAIEELATILRKAGVTDETITDISRHRMDPNTVVVTVSPAWHYQPRQARLSAAKSLWQRWALINTPENLDRSRIKLVDASGSEVGGSGMLAGSSISVVEE